MSEIEKVLKDVVYGSVGAVTTVLEVGAELAKTFVEKGQEAVRQGQERADEVMKAMKDACDAMMSDPGIDISGLNRAQRDELRRRLDEMDAAEDEAAQAELEECDEEEAVSPEAEIPAEDDAEDEIPMMLPEDEDSVPTMHVVEPISIDVTYEIGDDETKEDKGE